MPENPKYDPLLHGGRGIGPAPAINGIYDVAVRGDRIAAVEKAILPSSAAEVIDAAGDRGRTEVLIRSGHLRHGVRGLRHSWSLILGRHRVSGGAVPAYFLCNHHVISIRTY